MENAKIKTEAKTQVKKAAKVVKGTRQLSTAAPCTTLFMG